MVKQTTVVIKSIEKSELSFCNSQRIDVVVLDKDQPIAVHMSKTPSSTPQSSKDFDWFWTVAVEGMECLLIKHNNQNYLQPIYLMHICKP